MSAFFASLFQYAVKAVILGVLAFAGIVCGRKFRDRKSSQN